MRIDQEDAQVAARIEDLAQQQRDAARLADAGGAEHREVLAHHVVDIDVGGDRRVLLQRADVDRAGTRHVEDQPQLGLRDHVGRVADHRIFGDAALEVAARLLVLDLAQHVELRGRVRAGAGRAGAGRIDRDLGDDADDQRGAGADAEKLADGRAHVVGAGQARDVHAHVRLAAGDRLHAAERARRPPL